MLQIALTTAKKLFYLLVVSSLLLLFGFTNNALCAPIKIGVYENKPLVYLDSQGEYQGLSIDVLRYVAEREGWQLQFVPGSWSECLEHLERGEIDLQVAIAVSPARKKLYSYPEQTLLTNWGQLYRHPTVEIDSLLDLSGKKIALLKNDIHAQVFTELMDKFGQQVELVQFEDYDAVLEQVELGFADVGVVNRMYAMLNAERFRIVTTPMIFNPIEVRYATQKGKNSALRQALDRHIQLLRADKNSIYYQSLEKWFSKSEAGSLPGWVTPALAVLAAIILMIFAISLLLKRQVSRKTAELKTVNKQLRAQIDQLQSAKASLRESEEKYRTLLETTTEGFWMIDRDLKTVAVNDSLCKMLMYSAEEMIGQTAFKFVDKAYRKFLLEVTPEIHTTAHRTCEIGMLRKDGAKIDIVFNGTTLRDKAGRLQGAFAFITDITEHKKADRKLQKSEQKFRTLLNSQNDATLLHRLKADGFSTFSEVNEAAIKRYGYSHSEFLQLTGNDLRPNTREAREISETQRKKIIAQNGAIFESVHVTKSGREFPVEINAAILELEDEKYILSTVRDISERKKAEQEKQISNERFNTVLNSIGANIYVADMETYEILFMNQHMIEEFGGDFTGEICWDAFRNESQVCEHCSNELLIDEKGESTGMQIWQGENPLTGKYYMNHDRAIRWIDGRTVRLQISTDITEIRTLEAQLRQKYKMEAVGLMAGGIAHDFNNVLAIIITNLELMHRKLAADDPLLPRLEQAKSASLRASDLVKQILTYSRQGEQDLKPVQLAFIVEESIKLLRSTTPASIEIMTRMEPDALPGMINADAIQIEEVLINLCNNAIYAMREKGLLTVSLSKQQLDADTLSIAPDVNPGEYLKLCIEDTGSGMSQEVLDKIFDPFFTTKPAGHGTGMGLSISHGIVKTHGGYLTADSEPEHGSCFTLYLPTVTSRPADRPEKIRDDLPRGDEKILLIDDEELLANSVADFLGEHGYAVSIETDSRRALKQLQQGADFDLVVSDQTMPEVTGVELVSELMKIKPQLPIILCTGYSASLTEEKARQAGARALFMKPLALPELTRTIRALLDENKE